MPSTRLLPPGYARNDAWADVQAGATTWIMLVPQAMAYALLAGLPPQVGLYASLVPLVAYALLGSSRQLSVGPVALDSMMVAAAVAALGAASEEAALAAAVALTAMVGALQLVMGMLRMGFISNFLSRPVVSGFTSAAALLIASTQLGPLLGLKLVPGSLLQTLQQLVQGMPGLSPLALLVGGTSLLVLLVSNALAPKFPRGLLVVVLGTVASAVLDLGERGLWVVGDVPAGLPGLQLPCEWLGNRQLWASALPIAVVSFVEALSVGRHLARAGHYEIAASRELVALGAANVSSSLFGGYVVGGGFARSAVNAQAGARSQVAALATAALMALTLLVLTGLFQPLPRTVLAAIVLAALMGLVDVEQARKLWRVKRSDFWLLLVTFLATLVLGMQLGLLTGVMASIALFVVRATRPHMAVLGRLPGSTVYRNSKRFREATLVPGVLILRIDAQFYFGNVSFLKETVNRLREQQSELKAVVLDASGMNQLDSSALEALQELERDLRERGISLLLAHVKGPVRDVMERSGWLATLREEKRVYHRVHDAVQSALGHPAAGEGATLPPCVGELAD